MDPGRSLTLHVVPSVMEHLALLRARKVRLLVNERMAREYKELASVVWIDLLIPNENPQILLPYPIN